MSNERTHGAIIPWILCGRSLAVVRWQIPQSLRKGTYPCQILCWNICQSVLDAVPDMVKDWALTHHPLEPYESPHLKHRKAIFERDSSNSRMRSIASFAPTKGNPPWAWYRSFPWLDELVHTHLPSIQCGIPGPSLGDRQGRWVPPSRCCVN